LHKPGPLKGRTHCRSCPIGFTTPVSKILDLNLQEYVKELPFVLRNSYDLVTELTETPNEVPEDILLLTGDVEALYPNVQLKLLRSLFLA
jgi:hypothetical protein